MLLDSNAAETIVEIKISLVKELSLLQSLRNKSDDIVC
jgi:hypothetical protein